MNTAKSTLLQPQNTSGHTEWNTLFAPRTGICVSQEHFFLQWDMSWAPPPSVDREVSFYLAQGQELNKTDLWCSTFEKCTGKKKQQRNGVQSWSKTDVLPEVCQRKAYLHAPTQHTRDQLTLTVSPLAILSRKWVMCSVHSSMLAAGSHELYFWLQPRHFTRYHVSSSPVFCNTSRAPWGGFKRKFGSRASSAGMDDLRMCIGVAPPPTCKVSILPASLELTAARGRIPCRTRKQRIEHRRVLRLDKISWWAVETKPQIWVPYPPSSPLSPKNLGGGGGGQWTN